MTCLTWHTPFFLDITCFLCEGDQSNSTFGSTFRSRPQSRCRFPLARVVLGWVEVTRPKWPAMAVPSCFTVCGCCWVGLIFWFFEVLNGDVQADLLKSLPQERVKFFSSSSSEAAATTTSKISFFWLVIWDDLMGWHVVVFNTFRRKAVQDQRWPVQRFWNCWMRPFVFKAAWNASMLIPKDCYESQVIKNPNVCLNKNKTKRLLSKRMELYQPNTFDGQNPADYMVEEPTNSWYIVVYCLVHQQVSQI